MSKKDAIKQELADLTSEGAELLKLFAAKKERGFQVAYQKWYSGALLAVATLASDRIHEFRSYYEVDPKRKQLGYGTYVIADYFRGVAPSSYNHPNFDTRDEVQKCFTNQVTIMAAIVVRVDSLLADITGELYAELKDGEVAIARTLAKVSLRAAGALAGVVLEGHLQRVAHSRGVRVTKKHPTIGDLNDPLKAAGVIDTPTWRKISYLGDVRNLCSHRKDSEPTKEQVTELLDGTDWLLKNVF